MDVDDDIFFTSAGDDNPVERPAGGKGLFL